MLIPGSPVLHPSHIMNKGKQCQKLELLPHGKTFFYANARSSIAALLHNIEIHQQETALLPAYLCSSVTSPFINKGIQIKFYKIRDNFSIDLDDFHKKIDENVRLILVIHYFGFPQPDLVKVVELCQRERIFLLEDCAHSLFSRLGNRLLGSFGDASVFSLQKSLPVPDGGALIINNPEIITRLFHAQKQKLSFELMKLSKLFAYYLEYVTGFSFRAILLSNDRFRRQVYEMDDLSIQNPNYTISRFSARIVDTLDYDKIVQIRRDNFLYLLKRIAEINSVRSLFTHLPSGVCPIGFPILAENRDEIRNKFYRKGISLRTFWDVLPKVLNIEQFPISKFLSERILVLPVHQDVDLKQLDVIIDLLSTVAR